MEPAEYELMYQVEGCHWWYRGMEAITCAILRQWLPLISNNKILDAGCGTGAAMLTYLTDFGRVVGLDLSPVALKFCRLRNAGPLTRASVSALPFPSPTFDLVTSFDVLYARTVPDVLAALKEFARVLLPGGHLLLRLPAYDWLRGRHDQAVWTAHRFTISEVAALLQQSGFDLKHSTYANTFLFPLALAKRLVEPLIPVHEVSSDLALPPRWLNELFLAILSWEAPWTARHRLPFGLSLYALAQKT